MIIVWCECVMKPKLNTTNANIEKSLWICAKHLFQATHQYEKTSRLFFILSQSFALLFAHVLAILITFVLADALIHLDDVRIVYRKIHK